MTSRMFVPTLTATLTAAVIASLGVVAAPAGAHTDTPTRPAKAAPTHATPLVFGHRGAPGYRPEHTLAGYELAIRMGADYVEPDLVSTKDGVLVARHENEIGGTTDVADHPEFADRRTTKVIDGVSETGWFTEDFTLAELKTLRAKERLPQVRPGNTRYDGRFEVPTFEEVLDLVHAWEKKLHGTIGVAPETKHPTYFDSIGLSLEEPLVRALKRHHLDTARSAVVIQSFEVSNLRELHRRTSVALVQLTGASGGPFDLAGQGVTYAAMTTPAGLRDVAAYATWLGPDKAQVLPRNAAGATGTPSALLDDAHRAGLKVVVYTVRDENQFLPTNFRRGTDPNAKGDVRGEILALIDAGIDGFFADFADTAVDARDAWLAARA